ncbi:hypothetical protein FHT44_006531 [Mycolicibacterium sp. BK634]|uniref:hypothetical protein n=1 Tax=Mycolicibacterium sp. BK634 TaxID=2587099 RepID=UPI0016163315|nr:hypothetical protein [Mycolicibacterium sp. BK634]MBB3754009.1 hypothetical protein [Mycolicibacterium sp. BK634]
MINLVNIVQVIVVFALAYQKLPGGGPDAFNGSDQTPLSEPFSFLYLSWTTLFPPGSGYQPTSLTTRLLVMAESTSGLLIIGLTLAVLLSRMPSRGEHTAQQNSAQPPPQQPGQDVQAARQRVTELTAIIACILVAGTLGAFTGGVLAGIAVLG